MKITFQNTSDHTIEHMTGREQTLHQSAHGVQRLQSEKGFQGAYRLGLGEGSLENMIAGYESMGGALGGIDSMAQLQQMAGAVNGKVRQDFMTIMSNTMSDEDFGRMMKDGYSPSDMDPKETVTILDKIKAELAKAGKQVAGYNDDLDLETLEAALGSPSLAQSVSKSFSEADLPISDEMAGELREAWEMASALEKPKDGVYEYMLRDELSPRIANFYLAQNSGVGDGKHGNAMYYASGVQGYYAQAGNALDPVAEDSRFQEQVDQVILQAGMELTQESRADAKWLLEKNLPLTPEDLQQYKELTHVSFPVTEEQFAEAAARAVTEGISPKYAKLSEPSEETIYEKANRFAQQYKQGEMADRIVLEEIRLHMTSEVNMKLLQSGFAIDTAPMEELLEALRLAEKQVAEQYFPQAEDAVSKYQILEETNQIVKDFPGMPAKLLGVIQMGSQAEISQGGTNETELPKTTTLSEIYGAGREMQREYEQAREKYETLMTAPRADMGDSIRKAFANVDDILQDLGYEQNEENRKAVRVLGYNRMELSVENIDRVREAQRTVTNVIERMTPAAVLKMIRDEMNPLEKSFEELREYFENLPEDEAKTEESYSRFLYRLEQSKEITPDERASYIGIYRMLHQIDKKDGAAVGMLLNTGAELQFSNLLAAARTGNFGFMDVRLTDQEKTYVGLVKGDDAIDDQIEAAFYKMEREAFREASRVSEDAGELLRHANIVPTVNQLLAAEGLLEHAKEPFAVFAGKKPNERNARAASAESAEKKERPLDLLSGLWEKLEEEDFPEQYQENLSEFAKEVQGALYEAEEFVDVRSFQLASRQLGIAIRLRKEGAQEYFLPMELNDGTGKLHLTMEQAEGESGKVTVEVDAFGSKTKAEFSVRDGKVSGTLWGKGDDEVMKLTKAADILGTYLKEETTWSMDARLSVIDQTRTIDGKTGNGFANRVGRFLDGRATEMGQTGSAGATGPETVRSEELFRLAKAWIKAVTQKEVAYEN